MWQTPVNLKNRSKASQIAEAIQSHIDGHSLAAGEALGTKATLLERFGVSPGTLNVLQVRDYVVVRPGPKGAFSLARDGSAKALANLLLAA